MNDIKQRDKAWSMIRGIMIYRIVGYTNYECTEGPEIEYGEFDEFSESITEFCKLANDKNALDFTVLDCQVDEWIKAPSWKNDIYYNGYYGGKFILWAFDSLETENPREILIASRSRNPYTKDVVLDLIEFGDDIFDKEKTLFLIQKNKRKESKWQEENIIKKHIAFVKI